jgi:RNA polymerase sigma factor (sigma-70 family)
MTDDHAARDSDDAQLIERGDYARVLERYRSLIRRRVGMYLRGADADDVAAQVIAYLYAQLRGGRRFDAPFRVVAYNRAGWMAKDFLQAPKDLPLGDPGEWHHEPTSDDIDDWSYVRSLLAELPSRDREVFELRVYGGLSPREISERLGISRNAVDQAMFRACAALRKLIDG